MDRYTDYDPFAELYNRRWGRFAGTIEPTLDHLVLDALPAGARVLDLCCGTGQLLASLAERDLDLVGVDGSGEMLARAATNAPTAELLAADARAFTVDRPVDAVVSTFDSLNHLLTPADLAAAFARVGEALVPGGVFVFDLNNEAGYEERWRGSFADVTDDEVIAALSTWDPDAGTATITITHLTPAGDETGRWQRRDMPFTQRCHPDDEVRTSLAAAGLVDVERWDADRLDDRMGGGRSIYRAVKPTG